jgi:hypothetical protein
MRELSDSSLNRSPIAIHMVFLWLSRVERDYDTPATGTSGQSIVIVSLGCHPLLHMRW